MRNLDAFIRNPHTVWYGPHQCNGCGETIVKSSLESGGVALDAPHGHHYPNFPWKKHVCNGPLPLQKICSLGGVARAKSLSKTRRKKIATQAANVRWNNKRPSR